MAVSKNRGFKRISPNPALQEKQSKAAQWLPSSAVFTYFICRIVQHIGQSYNEWVYVTTNPFHA